MIKLYEAINYNDLKKIPFCIKIYLVIIVLTRFLDIILHFTIESITKGWVYEITIDAAAAVIIILLIHLFPYPKIV